MRIKTINEHVVVRALQKRRLSTTAAALAEYLDSQGYDTSSRAVATALRRPVEDGRVSRTWRRSKQQASYRFVRLKAKDGEE